MPELTNPTYIKIVAIRNDIAVLKDEFYMENPEVLNLLNTAYNAFDDVMIELEIV